MPVLRRTADSLLIALGAFFLTFKGVFAAPPLTELTASEAKDLLCSKQISAVEYNRALLDRAIDVACLNSYAVLNPEQVLSEAAEVDAKAARGESTKPLCGLGFVLKDNIDYTKYATQAGTPALAGNVPTRDNPLVTRLREANGVVLGKARMHELAYGYTTINPDNGTVLNPYNNFMHAGGSSGGTGAIIAARGATAGFCTDTGGSCRVPAGLTGTFGFRPSLGCWNSADGLVPMTYTRDTVGVMARSMDDIIMYDELFSDCPRPAEASYSSFKGLRLGYPNQIWDDLDEEVMPVMQKVLSALEQSGVEIVRFDYALLDYAVRKWVPYSLSCDWEMPRELSRYLWRHRSNVSVSELAEMIASPSVKSVLEHQLNMRLDTPEETPADHARMLREGQPDAIKLLRQHFEAYQLDALITPTTPIASRPIDNVEPWVETSNGWRETMEYYGHSMFLESALRLPGISLPAGLTAAGLPLGIQLSTQAGEDAQLLSLAKLIEPLLPETPPPPFPPPCQGCQAVVETQEVTFKGEGEPELDDVTSFTSFSLEGDCKLRHSADTGHGSSGQCSNAPEQAQRCASLM